MNENDGDGTLSVRQPGTWRKQTKPLQHGNTTGLSSNVYPSTVLLLYMSEPQRVPQTDTDNVAPLPSGEDKEVYRVVSNWRVVGENGWQAMAVWLSTIGCVEDLRLRAVCPSYLDTIRHDRTRYDRSRPFGRRGLFLVSFISSHLINIHPRATRAASTFHAEHRVCTWTKNGLNSLQSLISCLLRQLSFVRWADTVPGIHVSATAHANADKNENQRETRRFPFSMVPPLVSDSAQDFLPSSG